MNHSEFSSLVDGSLFHQRYRISRLIRFGNMGAVYEVIDEATDTPRALKVMLPSLLDDADLKSRFTQEAKITGPIHSDHIVKVTDAGIDATLKIPYLVMELLQGRELGSLLKERGSLPKGEVVVYLYQAALALDKTHAAGVVHRDLKPENIFVTMRDDGSPCVKILDFGIAKLVTQSAARGTRAMGTPLYMAPEQIRGDSSIGSHTDNYALAQLTYALLSGEPYWMEETQQAEAIFPVLAEIMKGTREAPSQRAARRSKRPIPEGFDAWFLKAACANPKERFSRATDAIRALGEALGVPLPTSSWLTSPPHVRDPIIPATQVPVTAAGSTPLPPAPVPPPPLVAMPPEPPAPVPPPPLVAMPPEPPAPVTSRLPEVIVAPPEPPPIAVLQSKSTPPIAPIYEKTTALDNVPPERTMTDGFMPPNEMQASVSAEPPSKVAAMGSGAVFDASSTKPTVALAPGPRRAVFVVPILAIIGGIAAYLMFLQNQTTTATAPPIDVAAHAANLPATPIAPEALRSDPPPTASVAPTPAETAALSASVDGGVGDAAPPKHDTSVNAAVTQVPAVQPSGYVPAKPKATSAAESNPYADSPKPPAPAPAPAPAPTKKREDLF